MIRDIQLLAGDRYAPSEYMTDVARFETMSWPFQLLFWRQSRNADGALLDAVVHRSPLIDGDQGTTHQTIAIDGLHSVYKGPVMRVSAAILWRTLLSNPWGVQGTLE